MLMLLQAALFGVFIGGLCWVLTHYYQSRSLVAGRISDLPANLSFPYDITKKSPFESKGMESLSLDDSYKDKIARKLFLAGFRSQAYVRLFHSLIRLGLILPVVLIIFYLLSGSLTSRNFLLSLTIGVVVTFCIHLVIRHLEQKRRGRISRALPEFLDLLVVCIEAGLNFTAAVARMIQEVDPKEPLTQEFRLMHHEFLSGISLREACDRLAKRCEVVDLSVILNAVIQSEEMGAALANTLRVQASELRDKHRQRMREKAYQLPIKLIFPAILILSTIFMVTLGPALYQLTHLLSGMTSGQARSPVSSE